MRIISGRKLMSLVLVMVMVLSLVSALPIPAMADSTATTEDQLKDIGLTGGTVRLDADITFKDNSTDKTNAWTISNNLTLDLNGHTLKIAISSDVARDANCIKVGKGKTLTVMDSSYEGTGRLDVRNTGENHFGAAINVTEANFVPVACMVAPGSAAAATEVAEFLQSTADLSMRLGVRVLQLAVELGELRAMYIFTAAM